MTVPPQPLSTLQAPSSPASSLPPKLALLGARDWDAPLAWRSGVPRSARHWLADAQALAARMPAGATSLVNLCADRYDFLVGFGAALLNGVPTLMPPNALPATLALLQRDYPKSWLVDHLDTDATELQALAVSDAAPMINGDLQAAVLLTSGSTGVPVPHGRTWRSVVLNAQAQAKRVQQALAARGVAGGLDTLTVVATVPPQHSYGFETSVTLSLLGGGALDAGRPFYPADIVTALDRVPRPRALVTTPFHLKTLLAADMPLPVADVIFCATAPLSPQLAAEAEQRLGGVLLEVYGCTEAGQVATRLPTQSPTWQTYGDLRVSRRAPSGDADESYWVEGGHVAVPTPLADVLDIDDGQHFRLLGRQGDLIHVAGKRSSLAHLNHHLNSIEGVSDGAFWMPPDAGSGDVVRPVAFVVSPTLSAAQVGQALQQRLDAVFVPRRIVLLPVIPRESTGKVTAGTLQALAQQHGLA